MARANSPTTPGNVGFLVIDNSVEKNYQKAYGDVHGVSFQFMDPNSANDRHPPNYNVVPTINRSEPYRIYANTDPRVISFSALLIATGLERAPIPGFSKNTESKKTRKYTVDEVRRDALFLKSLSYPSKSSTGLTLPPPILKLNLGDIFFNLSCFMLSGDLVYEAPFHEADEFVGSSSVKLEDVFLPMVIRMSIELSVVNPVPLSARDILKTAKGF